MKNVAGAQDDAGAHAEVRRCGGRGGGGGAECLGGSRGGAEVLRARGHCP